MQQHCRMQAMGNWHTSDQFHNGAGVNLCESSMSCHSHLIHIQSRTKEGGTLLLFVVIPCLSEYLYEAPDVKRYQHENMTKLYVSQYGQEDLCECSHSSTSMKMVDRIRKTKKNQKKTQHNLMWLVKD